MEAVLKSDGLALRIEYKQATLIGIEIKVECVLERTASYVSLARL